MGRALDFVGQGEREILEGNPAFSIRRGQKLVGPEPKLAGTLTCREQRLWRQERSI
jgi:hypothetical protein